MRQTLLREADALVSRLARMADPASDRYGALRKRLTDVLDVLGLQIEQPSKPGADAKRLPERALRGLSPMARRMYEQNLLEAGDDQADPA